MLVLGIVSHFDFSIYIFIKGGIVKFPLECTFQGLSIDVFKRRIIDVRILKNSIYILAEKNPTGLSV